MMVLDDDRRLYLFYIRADKLCQVLADWTEEEEGKNRTHLQVSFIDLPTINMAVIPSKSPHTSR